MASLRVLIGAALFCAFISCGRLNFDSTDASSSLTDADTDGSVATIQTGPVLATCFNNLQGEGETAVDCGGPCPPCGGAASCLELQMLNPNAASGVYQLDADGPGPVIPSFAYCEMVADGGGWTLVAKMDGNNAVNFVYDSTLWTTAVTLNENYPDMDATEAKLPTFNSVPFTQLRLGMMHNNVLRWIGITYSAGSFLSLFDNFTTVTLTEQRTTWLGLLSGSYLQPNCNLNGFNITGSGNAFLRIGIFGNNENDCTSPDSFLGFGSRIRTLGCSSFQVTTSTGNGATCVTAGNERDIKAFGYIMVR